MKKPEEIKKVKDDPTCFECNHYEVCQMWSNAGYPHKDNPKKCSHFAGRSSERRKISTLQTIVDEQDKVIQQLEAQVPRWISVEDEQKPKHHEDVLCRYVFSGNADCFYAVLTYYAYGDNGYVTGQHFTGEGLHDMRVTHWMPLPEPPKEDAHE